MKVAVWDTYVRKTDNNIMHFDIIVPSELKDEQRIFTFGKEYLQSKNQKGQPLDSKECRFCHIETASDEIVESINLRGYCILEMQNCE
jgi:Domain of unknown function (DUF2024)